MSDFQPSSILQFGNRLVTPLIRLGLPMGPRRAPMALLTVAGRRSGLPRTSPVALSPTSSGWWLVAVYGVSDWSRNLESAGRASLEMRRSIIEVDARRLPPAEAAPIIRNLIGQAPAMIQRMTARYFSARPESPIEDWEREADHHPVFHLGEVVESYL